MNIKWTILFCFLIISIVSAQKITEEDIYNKGIELDLIRNSLQSIFDTMKNYDKQDFAFYVLNDISLNADIVEARILNIIDLIRLKDILKINNGNTDFKDYISWRFTKLKEGFEVQIDWLTKTKAAMDNSKNYSVSSQISKLSDVVIYLRDSCSEVVNNGL